MRKMTKLVIAGLAFAGVGGAAAHAESLARIKSTNNSSESVWITYYNVTKNHLGTHCVKAHNTFTADFDWAQVTGSEGGVYLRFEYKQNTDCGGKTNYDSHYGGLYKMPALGQTLTVNIPAR